MLGSPIIFEYLSLVLSLRAGVQQERVTWTRATRCPKGGSGVNVIQCVSCLWMAASLGMGNDTIPHRLYIRLWSGT